ncbi:MAG: hydrogenase maturation protease [Parvularcula sp.]
MLILGLGNRLMTDDAVGPMVIDRLDGCVPPDTVLRDGGTIGMALLPEIEDAQMMIAIDAAYFGESPGTIRVFEDDAMEEQLGGNKKTAHEVALSDLMSAAALQGHLPKRRALVAVEPERIKLGLEPTPPVATAIPDMVSAVLALIQQWNPTDKTI